MEDLERAAEQAGAARAADVAFDDDDEDFASWLGGSSLLQEAPHSLVDLRALRFDEPLSHQMSPLSLEMEVDLQPGSVVDQKYEILGRAPRAAGGWEARHVVLRQKFVVQFLSHHIVDDPIIWPKFQHDIRAAGMLGHENIEFVTDLGRCEQFGAYLVKQWIDGPTLTQWLETAGPRPAAEAVAFAHSIGEAVAALHEIGIIHGRLSSSTIRRVETTDNAVWKILDVCIPGGHDELLAPEQQRGEATGPEADQYAIAYLTRMLLLGPSAVDLPDNVPAAMVAVLDTALHDVPLMRWPDVDTFVGELSRAVPVAPTPSIHPFDRREASRHIQQELDRDGLVEPLVPAAHTGFGDRPRSMLIQVVGGDQSAAIDVQFSTGARLRREYRRNMLAGGLFAPTTADLKVGSRVKVRLAFTPRDQAVELDGLVVTQDPGAADRPRGYGIAFDGAARRKIESFVRDLEQGLGIVPTDELRVKRALDSSAQIDPGAAFLLSRIGTGMQVGSARAMFSGLPYDFDECVSALIEQDFVEVATAAAPPQRVAPTPASAPARPPAKAAKPSAAEPQPASARPKPRALSDNEWGDIKRVLETVQYFEEQGNFMAVGRVLESATANAPHVAAFHHRLGLMRARFEMNLSAARDSMRRALELEPTNAEFAVSERYVATLIEMAGVRVVWERDVGEFRWVRTEPAVGMLWIEEKGATAALHEVNLTAGTSRRSVKGAGYRVVAENGADFDAIERRRPEPIGSGRERRFRQLEVAKRFGGYGPHFERDPRAVARTINSTLVATAQNGLVVSKGGANLAQLTTTPVSDVQFAPNEQFIAWLAQLPNGRWGLFVGPITGPGALRAEFSVRPHYFWSDDSATLFALDSAQQKLHAIDRRQGSKVLLEAAGSLEIALVRSVDDDSVLITGKRVVGKSRWFATWIDLTSGAVRGEYVLPGAPSGGMVRADGKLALVLQDQSLLVADLHRKVMKTLTTCNPLLDSVVGARWPARSPLIVAERIGGSARVLSIDVDLLCG